MRSNHFISRACLVFSFLSMVAGGAEDPRLGAMKDLNGDFSFTPPGTREAWNARAEQVRLRVKVAMGLHPLPERTPLNAVRYGRRVLDGYAVEKAYLEAFPGFFVTGSLYTPVGVSGKVPAVLCPHGHWPDGRFMRTTDSEMAQQLASGAEKDESAARSPLQSRCVHLARMGCVVFHYDMIGYADSVQLPMSLSHQFRAQRPEMQEGPQGWGFFSAAAEGRLQSIMGLQTWSSIRALDFLSGLEEVDPAKIGVTGASGGATQTFLLAAVDPRPAVIFPAVMVSTAMQGGCTCENASLLRVGTGNVELAALFAPKPAGYTAADDWTKAFSTKGYPQLQLIYKLTGAPDHLSLLNRTEFPHNYNLPSRMAMYEWMARHLKTPRPAPSAESAFELLGKAEMTVWDAAHPVPKAADLELERGLLKHWDAAAAKLIAEKPALSGEALPVLLGRTWEEAARGPFTWAPVADRPRDGTVQKVSGTLTAGTAGEQVQCDFLYPDNWSGKVLIRLDADPTLTMALPEVKKALAAGTAVAFPTLFIEHGTALGQIRRVAGDRDFLGYTAGYNPSPLARRAHDLMSLLAWMRQHEPRPREIELQVAAPLVPEAALALTQVPADVLVLADLEPTRFLFASLTDPFDPRLLPGAVKYGDLPGLLSLIRVPLAKQK